MHSIHHKNRNYNQKVFAHLAIVLFICSFIFSEKIFAQGDLLVIPKRVVFDGAKKSYELNVANTGKSTTTFQISFIQIRMNPDGKFENITVPDSGQFFAEPFVRFYPRKVTLAPNEAQTVKLQISKSNTLQQGEYRSHLYFRAVPKEHELLGTPDTPAKDSDISVKLTPIFGISVPIIMQVGNLSSAVTVSDLSLHIEKDNVPNLKVTFNRSGNKSVYGDLTVNHISPTGKETRVGLVKGIAVYTPLTARYFKLSLEKKAGVDYRSGKLNIVYTDQSQKPVELAKGELVL